jgi:hypothetical protein
MVPAQRQPLTTDAQSPVAHDNEVMALAPHAGRLFAATDQWEYSGPSAAGQVLVKDSRNSPWRVFEKTQSTRVQVIDSFPIPKDQGLGSGHSLLITQAIVHGRSEIQWLRDGAQSFTSSFALPSKNVDVRSFGAHESNGVWSVYAGARPSGILRGTWSRKRHTLVWSRKPELAAAPPGSPGLKTQKVTGFADCGGSLYVSINTKLYRRNDRSRRWSVVYEAPAVGRRNSGLRGLSCVSHAGRPSLLVSTEGDGNVYRFDRLTRRKLTPVLEFTPRVALQQIVGPQKIGYVIAAYNNFETVNGRQVFGIEWNYVGGCPASRTCASSSFDAAACFAVRTDGSYALRCLQLSPADRPYVAIRTMKASPFGDGRLYYGGYDCNFSPADGAAWIASSTLNAALR